jgi:hypothetical protein
MQALLLSDLARALLHVLNEKTEALERTLCGQLYRPHLATQLEAIEALPSAAPFARRPLAEAVAEAEVCSETITLLSELRTALADELTADPVALDHLDTELFAFIDELTADREASVKRRTRPTTEVTPASVLTETPPSSETVG